MKVRLVQTLRRCDDNDILREAFRQEVMVYGGWSGMTLDEAAGERGPKKRIVYRYWAKVEEPACFMLSMSTCGTVTHLSNISLSSTDC